MGKCDCNNNLRFKICMYLFIACFWKAAQRPVKIWNMLGQSCLMWPPVWALLCIHSSCPCKSIVGGKERGRKEDFLPVEWLLTLAAGGENEFCWNAAKTLLHKHCCYIHLAHHCFIAFFCTSSWGWRNTVRSWHGKECLPAIAELYILIEPVV